MPPPIAIRPPIETAKDLPRQAYVSGAWRAILASTSPWTRWHMLRDGYQHFERTAIPAFATAAGIRFTSAEVRHIWGRVKYWTLKHEGHLHDQIAEIYAKQRRRSTPEKSTRPEWQGEGDGISVESLPEHLKRRLN